MPRRTVRRMPASFRFELSVFLLAIALGCAGTAFASNGSWPHLRSGVQGALAGDALDLSLDWRVDLGSGYSGVVVAGGKAVTSFADGSGRDVVAAFDVTSGAELWRVDLAPTFQGQAGAQDGPVATPTVEGGTVYMVSPHGPMVALALVDGAEQWRVHLVEDLGATVPFYGIGATPLVVDGVVVIESEIEGKGALHGFDAKDGTLRWSAIDDSVGYQAPIRSTLDGVRQVVTVTDNLITGLDPANGEVLWQVSHAEENEEGIAQPVVVRQQDSGATLEGVLVHYWSDPAKMFRISRDEAGAWTAELAWESKDVGRSYAISQVFDGRIYGQRGNYLYVLDANTGETLWRSRPPGARGLSLVGDKLVAVDRNGDVVVSPAAADGWHEIARSSALTIDGYTTASYADGRVFVRNLEHLASVSVGAEPTDAVDNPSPLDPGSDRVGIMAWLDERLGAADPAARPALVEQFLAGRDLPIVESVDGRTWVHFLFLGAAQDVGLSSTIYPRGQEPMRQFPGTDLWTVSVELVPDGVWQYGLVVDFGDRQSDPRNPRLAAPGAASSWFHTGAWTASPRLAPAPAGETGQLEVFDLASEIRGDTRAVRLLVPQPEDPAPRRLLVVTDGDETFTHGLANVVDQMAAAADLTPLVVAFVPFGGWEETGFTATSDFARLLAEELVPAVEEHLGNRIDWAEGGHFLFGPSDGATGSLVAALRHPDVFSRVALLDLQSWDESEDLVRRVLADGRSGRPAVRFDWTTTGVSSPALGRSSLKDRDWLPAALTADGIEVRSVDFPGGPGYASWRGRFDEIVLWLAGAD